MLSSVVLCIVALAGVAVTVGALVALHIAPTGLAAVRAPVSAYGISRYRRFYRVQTLGTAVSAAALAGALVASTLSFVAPAVISLIILAAARGAISWFPMDAESAASTTRGRMHNFLAYVAFAAASVGGFMTGIAFSGTANHHVAAAASATLGWIMTGASLVTILATRLSVVKPIFGLAERVIYLGMLSWLTVISLTTISG